MDATRLQNIVDRAYDKGAAILGRPFDVVRPPPGAMALDPTAQTVATVPTSFVNAKDSGYKYNKVQGFEDVLWTAIVSSARVRVGDVLIGQASDRFAGGATYYVATIAPLQPISCVLCDHSVKLTRETSQLSTGGGQGGGLPSQTGSAGTYWGSSAAEVTNTDPGRTVLVSNIPCAILGTTGKASGNGQLPSDAPGPSRWRIYLPPSLCPNGSVHDRDLIIDEHGATYQVTAAVWTPLGYRAETVRLEN